MAIWLQLTAVAADGAGGPAANGFEVALGVEEVVVYGEARVRDARERLARACKAQGWSVVRRSDDAIVLAPPRGWMGRATLHRDGRLDFGRPMLVYAGTSTPERAYDADAVMDRTSTTGVAIQTAVTVPSRARLESVHARLLEAVGAELRAYRWAIEGASYRVSSEELVERLDRVWSEGVPLERAGYLPDAAARRREVLAYWGSRAATPEGDGVSRAIEVWLRQVVETSDTPLTAEEIDAAQAMREDGRLLSLAAP